VVTYGFSGAPLSAEDRLINPLGFQVSHYRRDAEGAAPAMAPPIAPAAAPMMPGMVK
jgi:type IV secretion system protein VirB8